MNIHQLDKADKKKDQLHQSLLNMFLPDIDYKRRLILTPMFLVDTECILTTLWGHKCLVHRTNMMQTRRLKMCPLDKGCKTRLRPENTSLLYN